MLRCCYCGNLATGRYVFLNAGEDVVDNPFCSKHNTEVFRQTKKSLESLHSSSVPARQYLIIERWAATEAPPELPKDKQALFLRGPIYMH